MSSDLRNKLFSTWYEAKTAAQEILRVIDDTGNHTPLDVTMAVEELVERLAHTAKRQWIWVDDPSGVNDWINDPQPDPGE